ncbi:MAG TPA: GDSL-type esterase/lipase family protein [Polyangia bacterium]
MLAHVPSRRALLWFLPATAAAFTALTLGAGFVLALNGRFGEALAPLPSKPAALSREGVYRVVALGDSISFGVGDGRGGYTGRLVESLRKSRPEVRFANLAVSGHETRDVLRILAGAEAKRQVEAADLILMSAGGNDLSHGLRSLTTEDARPPESALGDARNNLAEILRRLRALNPRATIRVLGIYNPLEVLPDEAAKARAQLLLWNTAIEEAAVPHAGVVVVPIADLFAERPELLAGDRYHPGSRGHELIAARVLATLPEP